MSDPRRRLRTLPALLGLPGLPALLGLLALLDLLGGGGPAPGLAVESAPAPLTASVSASASAAGPVGLFRWPSASAAGPVRSFRWPVEGAPRVVRRFDPPPRPWSPGHRGVDLAAEPGVLVRAAGDGVILYAGQLAGRPVVSVRHANGLRTTYEPVLPGVRAGTAVRAGDPLGVLLPGHPGCPVAACLHWGLRRGASYLDPLALLGLGRVRLLPAYGPSQLEI